MAYNVSQKLSDNIQAVQIALTASGDRPVTEEQLEVLQRFSGFGGIKAILFPRAGIEKWKQEDASESDLRLYPKVMEFHDLLSKHFNEKEYKEAIDLVRNSAITAFYTPDIIPRTLYRAFHQEGITPKYVYEPSAGAGIFIHELFKAFPDVQQLTAVEKDKLTARVLEASLSIWSGLHRVWNMPFEQTHRKDDGHYDFIVSNIPFGNFHVGDNSFHESHITSKIHNYFFAKGLQKLADGGLLAFITSDGFLNSASNFEARKYLFERADFVSVSVMPDNLMKDTGNTEAPSHLLIVQKNERKVSLSADEQELLKTVTRQNEKDSYEYNSYIASHPEVITGNEIGEGKNQYGQPHERVWQKGSIDAIADPLFSLLTADISTRFNKQAYQRLIHNQRDRGVLREHRNQPEYSDQPMQEVVSKPETSLQNKGLATLTYLDPPIVKATSANAQAGLFDSAPELLNKASAYLSDKDNKDVLADTARIVATIRTKDKLNHDSIVLITAKSNAKRYKYRLFSNLKEIKVASKWLDGDDLKPHLEQLSKELKRFDHHYTHTGDSSLNEYFALLEDAPSVYTNLKSFHKNGALVAVHGHIGLLKDVDKENDQATFIPLKVNHKDTRFFERYVGMRDQYFDLFEKESTEHTEHLELRAALYGSYAAFTGAYGQLNSHANRTRITEDTAFGDMILASLERKSGNDFVPSDFLTQSLHVEQKPFTTDDPIEALAHTLNAVGKVDLGAISSLLGGSEPEAIEALGNHIYFNPGTSEWETKDQYLSGNVVEKRKMAELAAAQNPADAQLQRSLAAISNAQPEPIPYELLDFNLGERWIPASYYSEFASKLFDQKATVQYLSSVDIFRVETDKKGGKVSKEYAISPKSGNKMYGDTIFEHALENSYPTFTFEIDGPKGSKIRMTDSDATQLAHQRIESIRSAFIDYMRQLAPDQQREIATLYNDTYNCYRLREYNGDHLQFPGLNRDGVGIIDLFSSQKSAVWRILQNRGALIDHEVGLGKTLTLIVAAVEMKRLGISRKPGILALKANVSQIADTFRRAYPKSRILAPSEDDFTPSKRQRLFLEIKNNNWDAVILTHDQFGKIQQAPAIQQKILQDEIDNLEKDLEALADLGGELTNVSAKAWKFEKTTSRSA